MSEAESTPPEPRLGGKTKKEIEDLKVEVADLKRAVVAILTAIAAAEDEIGQPLMPEGIYYGKRFADD